MNDLNLRAVEWDQRGHRDRMEQLLDIHYRHEGYERLDARDPGGLSAKLRQYFDGDLAIIDTLPTATGGTPFQRQVWQALRTIPCGQVMHYGQFSRGSRPPRRGPCGRRGKRFQSGQHCGSLPSGDWP